LILVFITKEFIILEANMSNLPCPSLEKRGHINKHKGYDRFPPFIKEGEGGLLKNKGS
jgi:hypothetical protein